MTDLDRVIEALRAIAGDPTWYGTLTVEVQAGHPTRLIRATEIRSMRIKDLTVHGTIGQTAASK